MKKACVMDGGLETLLKDYRHNHAMLKRHTASISSSYSTLGITVVLVIAYTIIIIQPSLFSAEVFKRR